MNLIEALKQMQPNDKIRRALWPGEQHWTVSAISGIFNELGHHCNVTKGNAVADDWEIVHVYSPVEIEALRMAMLEAADKAMCNSLSPLFPQHQSAWLAARDAYNKAKETTNEH